MERRQRVIVGQGASPGNRWPRIRETLFFGPRDISPRCSPSTVLPYRSQDKLGTGCWYGSRCAAASNVLSRSRISRICRSKISGCPGRERAQTPFVQLEVSFRAAFSPVEWPRRSYFKRDSWKATWTQRLRLGVPRAKPAEPVDVHTTPGSQAASTCIPTYQSTSFRHYTISFSSRAFSFSSTPSARGSSFSGGEEKWNPRKTVDRTNPCNCVTGIRGSRGPVLREEMNGDAWILSPRALTSPPTIRHQSPRGSATKGVRYDPQQRRCDKNEQTAKISSTSSNPRPCGQQLESTRLDL